MTKQLFLLGLLFIPVTAFATDIYDVSCGNIGKIRIVRIAATHWNIESYQGSFHVLALELKKSAAKEFVKLRKAAPIVQHQYRGEVIPVEDIRITANGRPLRDDAPALTGFADQGINIPIIREEDAFAAARAVCPALVPDKVLIDGHWE
ncbi:MAG: hypothetical protein H0S85_15125 [Desulfovibrionaceae bacterium]|nr:hypothetical protein [Desulfovibrionaceae bacterium]